MNKQLVILNSLKDKIYKILKPIDGSLIHNCDNFKNFTGRDVDIFYSGKKIEKLHKDTIILYKKKKNLRLYVNHKKSVHFLSIDLEEISSLPTFIKKKIEHDFNKKNYCKKTKLNHLNQENIIFYKLYKYFVISINSYNQLKILKKNINKLKKKNFLLLKKSVNKNFFKENKSINKFLNWSFIKFKNDKEVKNFFLKLNAKRNKKRVIFAGNLKIKKVLFSYKFIKALVFGSFARWSNNHCPMPALAIVGNDGSGKTTTVNFIKKNYSKMNPLILDMKTKSPYFPFIIKFLNKLVNIKKFKFFQKNSLLNLSIYFLGEFLIILDKFVRYKIGMAWADSGKGLTIFERYPTDRIRGEFPSDKKIFPLEQFFPMPDGIIYLDASPMASVKRKKNDNHSIQEMIGKRKNYLSLLKEFDETCIIFPTKNINEKIIKVKNYIFELYRKKKLNINKLNKVKRVFWKKNYRRKLIISVFFSKNYSNYL